MRTCTRENDLWSSVPTAGSETSGTFATPLRNSLIRASFPLRSTGPNKRKKPWWCSGIAPDSWSFICYHRLIGSFVSVILSDREVAVEFPKLLRWREAVRPKTLGFMRKKISLNGGIRVKVLKCRVVFCFSRLSQETELLRTRATRRDQAATRRGVCLQTSSASHTCLCC
ncbi:hypothetical protein KCU92_g171, partial [Aureobasidium melanogenum]